MREREGERGNDNSNKSCDRKSPHSYENTKKGFLTWKECGTGEKRPLRERKHELNLEGWSGVSPGKGPLCVGK